MLVRKLDIEELEKLGTVKRYKDIEETVAWNKLFIARGLLDIYGAFNNAGVLVGKLHIAYAYIPDVCASPLVLRNRRAYIWAFLIHPNFRNQGIGNQMLQLVIEDLTKKGYTEATVGVAFDNDRARHLYEKYGFTTFIGRESYVDGHETIVYDLLLRRA